LQLLHLHQTCQATHGVNQSDGSISKMQPSKRVHSFDTHTTTTQDGSFLTVSQTQTEHSLASHGANLSDTLISQMYSLTEKVFLATHTTTTQDGSHSKTVQLLQRHTELPSYQHHQEGLDHQEGLVEAQHKVRHQNRLLPQHFPQQLPQLSQPTPLKSSHSSLTFKLRYKPSSQSKVEQLQQLQLHTQETSISIWKDQMSQPSKTSS